jgi:hypothetical protein
VFILPLLATEIDKLKFRVREYSNRKSPDLMKCALKAAGKFEAVDEIIRVKEMRGYRPWRRFDNM